jgi:predicted RNase H-like nuclease
MLNVTWVIDFGWRAPQARAVRVVGETGRTLRMVERRRRESREMFAATRTLLAEARAALAASTVVARQSRGSAVQRHASAGHAVAGWNPTHD